MYTSEGEEINIRRKGVMMGSQGQKISAHVVKEAERSDRILSPRVLNVCRGVHLTIQLPNFFEMEAKVRWTEILARSEYRRSHTS
jgi:hypothetical protein